MTTLTTRFVSAAAAVVSMASLGLAAPLPTWIDHVNGTPNEADRALDLVADGSGNTYVCGSVAFRPEPSLIIGRFTVVKYSPSGQRLWTYTHVPSTNGTGHLIALDPVGGGVVVAGLLDFSQWDAVKLDASGNHVWTRSYFRTDTSIVPPQALEVSADGSVWMTGPDVLTLNSVPGATLLKWDAAGTPLVQLLYTNGADGFNPSALAVEPGTGSVYIAGATGIFGEGDGTDMGLMKFDASGTHQWTRRYGAPGPFGSDVADAVAIDSAGNIVAGGSYGINTIDQNFGFFKVNPSGVVQWTRNVGGPANQADSLFSMALAPNGDILGVGSFTSAAGDSDAAVVRLDSGGNPLWTRVVGVPTWTDFFWDVATDSAGNSYTAGRLYLTTGNFAAGLIKHAPDGATLFDARYGPTVGRSGDWQRVRTAVHPDGVTRVHVCGSSFAPVTRQDMSSAVYLSVPPLCAGDLTGDNLVNTQDLTVFLAAFGTVVSPGTSGDLNNDGTVNTADLVIFLTAFGTAC